jgi:hypothetical protein
MKYRKWGRQNGTKRIRGPLKKKRVTKKRFTGTGKEIRKRSRPILDRNRGHKREGVKC